MKFPLLFFLQISVSVYPYEKDFFFYMELWYAAMYIDVLHKFQAPFIH